MKLAASSVVQPNIGDRSAVKVAVLLGAGSEDSDIRPMNAKSNCFEFPLGIASLWS